MESELNTNQLCPICLQDIPESDPNILDLLCSPNENHPVVHKSCIVFYIESKIIDCSTGICPIVYCPITHQDKEHHVLNYYHWKGFVGANIVSKYSSQAASILSILCGGCHAVRSIFINAATTQSQIDQVNKSLRQHMKSEEEFQQLLEAIINYDTGVYSSDSFYQTLTTVYIPKFTFWSNKESWLNFQNILQLVQNPERRATLHLRFIQDVPRIWTTCCNREHCFRCKTKDFHAGKTCLENMSSLDDNILACPNCSVSLMKGDGCNSVTCICGKQFAWSAERDINDRALEFSSLYPENTAQNCVNILCRLQSGHLEQARAWKIRNSVTTNKLLMNMWKEDNSPYPTQAVLIKSTESLTEGYRMAAELWSAANQIELQKLRESNIKAKAALFLSMYPTDEDRCRGARELMSSSTASSVNEQFRTSDDNQMLASAKIWIAENREHYERSIENYEKRLADQFLFLYGKRSICFSNLKNEFSGPSEWNEVVSNGALIFQNNGKTVTRPGSSSCYPCAFANLTGQQSSLTVLLQEAPRAPNWLTFGLAKRNFPASSSNGIGRTLNSWGIFDDRSNSAANISSFGSNGHAEQHCRKLQEGDILRCTVDLNECFVEIDINNKECSHRFDLPATDCVNFDDLMFAMTFANDHKATVISETPFIYSGIEALNNQHSLMHQSFRKHLRRMIVSDPNIEITDEMRRNSMIWISYIDSIKKIGNEADGSGNQDTILMGSFTMIEPFINMIIQNYSNYDNSDDSGKIGKVIPTWQLVYQAACWRIVNKDIIDHELKLELAKLFFMQHQESSAFMAATILSNQSNSLGRRGATDRECNRINFDDKSIKEAKAFMQIYSEEMNAWYEYNNSLDDPLLDTRHMAKRCKCVPRCYDQCKNPN